MEIIYRALAARDKKRVAATVDTVEIVERAHAGDALALETVECFCGILGAFAGSVALTLGSLGGVYIGGGVALKLGELFTRSSFRARFEAKGRFTHYLENIPTYLITAEYRRSSACRRSSPSSCRTARAARRRPCSNGSARCATR